MGNVKAQYLGPLSIFLEHIKYYEHLRTMQCISHSSLHLVRLGELLRCLSGLFEKPQKVFLAVSLSVTKCNTQTESKNRTSNQRVGQILSQNKSRIPSPCISGPVFQQLVLCFWRLCHHPAAGKSKSNHLETCQPWKATPFSMLSHLTQTWKWSPCRDMLPHAAPVCLSLHIIAPTPHVESCGRAESAVPHQFPRVPGSWALSEPLRGCQSKWSPFPSRRRLAECRPWWHVLTLKMR